MKTIIAGSRSFTDFSLLCKVMKEFETIITEVVSGTASGADKLGERWARKHKLPIKRFPANWNKFGRSAGIKRNIQMAKYAEVLVAFWDGKSKGTSHMITYAQQQRLHVKIFQY